VKAYGGLKKGEGRGNGSGSEEAEVEAEMKMKRMWQRKYKRKRNLREQVCTVKTKRNQLTKTIDEVKSYR
jgi:hypothetical protein